MNLVAETAKYRVYQVRWPVLNRVFGEGLLLQPKTKPIANIIAIPDASQEPEQLVGSSKDILRITICASSCGKRFQVLVPVIISRTFLFRDGTAANISGMDLQASLSYGTTYYRVRSAENNVGNRLVQTIDRKNLKSAVAGYVKEGS